MSNYASESSELKEEYGSDFLDDDNENNDNEEENTTKNNKRKTLKKTKTLKKKKKTKRDVRSFLQIEASEGSEEESPEEDMPEHEKKILEKQRKMMEAQLKRRTRSLSFLGYEKEEDLDEYFKEAALKKETEEEENNIRAFPTPADPKIFAVKCKPKEEREACMLVMQKYFDCLGSPAEFQIFSATAVDKTEGFIYVEAFSDKHVYLAIADISVIYSGKVTVVSFLDRTQIFETDPTKNVEVKARQWVRIRKGLYDGDLAQVEEVNEQKGRVLIKLVPRLLPPSEDNNEEEKKESKGNSKGRPQQRLFQENEYQGWTAVRDAGKGLSFYLYKGNRFCNGLLYKWLPKKGVETQNIVVTFEESRLFTLGEATDPGVLNTLIEQVKMKPIRFFKGDRVKVVKGDLMNLEAEIVKIGPTALTVRPMNTEMIDVVEVSPLDCTKAFTKGDYVKVAEGENAGKEGFVISIEDNIVTIMADGLRNKVQAFSNDLVLFNDSTRTIDVKEKESKRSELDCVKFDLLKLNDHNTVGIVLACTGNAWKILENSGNTRTVSVFQVSQKLDTRNSLTKNDKGQVLRQNDSVRILQGKYKGQIGMVKHVYSDLVYVYNPDVPQNMGIIIEKANNCYLLSAQTDTSRRFTGPREKDELVGQRCLVKQGPWKGYYGIVKGGNETTVRIELSARCQVIDVKRDLVIPASEVGKKHDIIEIEASEPKTPRIQRSLQSPFFSLSSPGFENSPNWEGVESPAYEGGWK